MWIENLEGPYESIPLPSQPPDKPNTLTNAEEIVEAQRSQHSFDINLATDQREVSQYENVINSRTMKNDNHKMQYRSNNTTSN